MTAPSTCSAEEIRGAVVCRQCHRTMARDANSAANILSLALTLLIKGEPPPALRWYDIERCTSYHSSDPWKGFRAAPLADPDGRFKDILKAAALEPKPRHEAQASECTQLVEHLASFHTATVRSHAESASTESTLPALAGAACSSAVFEITFLEHDTSMLIEDSDLNAMSDQVSEPLAALQLLSKCV